ncbi:hypothetical protein B0H17DRAFT_1137910 [Mycena rosella]|uniref:Uncharacterized protein n=1 Tax=Mycena rosella TaxID=1033263 RepID=A0AAD7GCY2_MYCRO|nr:hypothetical protein B0H17DRAFT_1137910 [Mycena rosella]
MAMLSPAICGPPFVAIHISFSYLVHLQQLVWFVGGQVHWWHQEQQLDRGPACREGPMNVEGQATATVHVPEHAPVVGNGPEPGLVPTHLSACHQRMKRGYDRQRRGHCWTRQPQSIHFKAQLVLAHLVTALGSNGPAAVIAGDELGVLAMLKQ